MNCSENGVNIIGQGVETLGHNPSVSVCVRACVRVFTICFTMICLCIGPDNDVFVCLDLCVNKRYATLNNNNRILLRFQNRHDMFKICQVCVLVRTERGTGNKNETRFHDMSGTDPHGRYVSSLVRT